MANEDSSVEIQRLSTTDSQLVAQTARALAVKLMTGYLERVPSEERAAALAISTCQAAVIMIAQVCGVPQSDLHIYLDQSWEALAPIFEDSRLEIPKGYFRGSGGDA